MQCSVLCCVHQLYITIGILTCTVTKLGLDLFCVCVNLVLTFCVHLGVSLAFCVFLLSCFCCVEFFRQYYSQEIGWEKRL